MTGRLAFSEISDLHAAAGAPGSSDDSDDSDSADGQSSSLATVPELLTVGQLVPCSIVRLQKHKGHTRVDVSIRVSNLNASLVAASLNAGAAVPGCITSVEDHGYVVDFGTDAKLSGFLPFDRTQSQSLRPGSLINCLVLPESKKKKKKKTESRVLTLSSEHNTISTALLNDYPGLSLAALKCGMLVKATVAEAFRTGLVLRFFRFYVGVVNILHTGGQIDDASTWPKKGDTVQARVLYVDVEHKVIGLTLKPELVEMRHKSIPDAVAIGTMHERAKVVRVDGILGLHLRMQNIEGWMGFAHISQLTDDHLDKIGSKYTVGTEHTCRVVGHNILDAVANVSMQQSVIEAPFLRYEDVLSGTEVNGKVLSVEPYGVLVTLADNIRGLCPSVHLGEVVIKNPASKFKPGNKVKCMVLSVNASRGRVTLTMKKSMIKSKLTHILTYSDARPGMVVDGYISAIKPFGCIVSYYNDVSSLAPRSMLGVRGLDADADLQQSFRLGQTVQVKIVSCTPADRKMIVSMDMSTKVETCNDDISRLIGTLVKGIVTEKSDVGLNIRVSTGEGTDLTGQLVLHHLSDHVSLCDELFETCSVGQEIEGLLVLNGSASKRRLFLTRKKSLIEAAEAKKLPISIQSLTKGETFHGYVHNVTQFGVFVRFAGILTGLAMRSNVADEFVTDPNNFFRQGQSVRAQVVKVDEAADKIELSLKQSVCMGDNDIFLRSLVEDMVAVARRANEQVWWSNMSIGAKIEGRVEDKRYGGIIVDLGDEVTGFVKQEHCVGVECEIGKTISGRILDIDPKKRIVDLTVMPDLLQDVKTKKVRKRQSSTTKVGLTTRGSVLLVKTGYAVILLDATGHFCVVACNDFNGNSGGSMNLDYRAQVTIMISRLDTDHSSTSPHRGAFYGVFKSENGSNKNSNERKRTKHFDLNNGIKSIADVKTGMRTSGQICKIHRAYMVVSLGPKVVGRVHITQVSDNSSGQKSVFADHEVGQQVNVLVSSVKTDEDDKRLIELSLRQSAIDSGSASVVSFDDLKTGQPIDGVVDKFEDGVIWVHVSSGIRGRILVIDAVRSVAESETLADRYQPGIPIACFVVAADREKRRLDLNFGPESATIVAGERCLGRIHRIQEGEALYVQLPHGKYGRLAITEIKEKLDTHPMKDCDLGKLIDCRIIDVDGQQKYIDLTVRSERSTESGDCRDIIDAAELQPGQTVKGYIRSISSVGCFINLSRAVVGRVVLRELSNSYVKDVEKEFPIGKLVTGQIMSVNSETRKIEISLKAAAAAKAEKFKFEDLALGQVVKCTVKRLETYGLFLSLQNTSLVGLCHKTEVADRAINDLSRVYSPGDYVKAIILKLNPAKRQISLGLKPSYMASQIGISSEEDDSVPNIDNEKEDEAVSRTSGQSDDEDTDDSDDENTGSAVLPLDELDVEFDMGFDNSSKVNVSSKSGREVSQDVNSDNQSSKREDDATYSDDDDHHDYHDEGNKEGGAAEAQDDTSDSDSNEKSVDREMTLAAREADLVNETSTSTMTESDYEREIITSPNSSVAWIKLMAFQLSIGQIAKARETVEKALTSISFREEDEKFNVWVAFLNLEKMYGTQETLQQAFERAIVYNDAKKVYSKMVEIHKTAKEYTIVEDLYKVMSKKFKTSLDIWCQYAQYMIQQGKTTGAKKILERGLKCLDKSKHVSLISKFGELEFKFGDPERGRTYFESVIDNAPRRVDIWSVYIDMEIKTKDDKRIRRLFERATSLQLSTKKMKFLFKRYLEYAKNSNADAATIEHIREKARSYVESKTL
eukprot:SAG31_NODE_1247_length_9127_cov_2.629929_3_plen_1785_part_00